MPPRLSILQATRFSRAAVEPSPATSLTALFAGLSIQFRSAHILASLSDNKGAYNKRIRKGRGPSSGKGKTSGRGHKGQRQHGHVHPWFQGGQTPLIRSKGQKGFINLHKLDMTEINVGTIQKYIDEGRLDVKKQITVKELWDAKLLTRLRDGVKLLAGGMEELKAPIDIMVSRASTQAIAAVEAAGGKVVTRYYTKDSMARLIKGLSISTDKPLPVGRRHVAKVLEEHRARDKFYYRLPDPTGRKDIEYYRDPAHRGYMSHLLQAGESPSLFYKVPPQIKKRTIAEEKAAAKLGRDASGPKKRVDTMRLWE
ncbi:putative 54s ribosomal protein l10 protein [Zalerion maritima]|uniref:54s ribosomal protein l10 protein n=1 Tax=Zalerion maritima TaxID=339359 RepID=A0AAD5RLK1_9PEZI|nr:putative 54s ribosomal protein l10 protein [Zalerion maritima]